MGMIKEFKEFAVKGNVIDMAIGIIIGAAFGKVVVSLVSDIIMPPIGLMIGGVDFASLAWVIKDATELTDAVTIKYGLFINTLINFVIVAFAIFLVVKGMNKAKKKEEEKPAAPPKTSDEVVLLTEIRDSLKK